MLIGTKRFFGMEDVSVAVLSGPVPVRHGHSTFLLILSTVRTEPGGRQEEGVRESLPSPFRSPDANILENREFFDTPWCFDAGTQDGQVRVFSDKSSC